MGSIHLILNEIERLNDSKNEMESNHGMKNKVVQGKKQQKAGRRARDSEYIFYRGVG